MTVKDIALSATTVLQADDIAELISAETIDGQSAEIVDADVKTLVKCVNLAVAELGYDLPVVNTKTVRATGGYIPLDEFDGTVSTVREVRRYGRAVRFSLSTKGVKVGCDGEYAVDYTVAPCESNLDDEVALGVGADPDVLCYLTARNYCLVTGRNDEASIWDQRYNAEAEKRRISRRAVLPRRAWV